MKQPHLRSVIALSLLGATSLSAAWQKVYDWEASTVPTFTRMSEEFPDGNLWRFVDSTGAKPYGDITQLHGSGADGLLEIVDDDGDHVLRCTPGTLTGLTTESNFPFPEIPITGKATLFLRGRFTNPGQNSFFGLGDVTDMNTRWNAYEVQFGTGPGDTGFLVARNANTVYRTTFALQDNVWNWFWVVIDNDTVTFSMYAKQEGSSEDPVLVAENIGFRFGLGEANPLIVFKLVNYTGGGSPFGDTYCDDIYLDLAGANLTAPIESTPPPPACDLFSDNDWVRYDGGFVASVQTGQFYWVGACPFVWDYTNAAWLYLFTSETPGGSYAYNFSDSKFYFVFDGFVLAL